jgi:hypothetical protein
MSKSLLVLALLAYLTYTPDTKAGDNTAGNSIDSKLSNENSYTSQYAVYSDPEDPDAGNAGEEKDSVDALTVFSAKIKDKTVYLNWRILNPKSISYFDVLKLNTKKNEYIKINDERIKKDDFFDKAEKENENVFMYDFEDEPERDGVYYYKLKAYNSNNQVLFESDEIKIGITGIRNFKLEQNMPNPFNPTTNITYELFDASYVKLKVFDLIGKEIATLVDGEQTKGTYTVQFDASNYANLTSGIYFYKIETSKYSEVKKMILTK